jgi:Nuclease A inhibitor-like protein
MGSASAGSRNMGWFFPMFTRAMALSDTEIVALITVATTDLLWASESDQPFTVLLWPELGQAKLDASALALQIQATTKQAIVPVDLDTFFQPAIEPHEWHGADERAVVDRYQQLLFTLQQELTDLQVYRVGHCEVDVYIVGRTPAGHWLALQTMVVES